MTVSSIPGPAAAPAGVPAAARGVWRRLVPATIRGKLMLAFGVILLSAIMGIAVGYRANLIVQQQMSEITEGNLPALVTAHRVSELMTNIRGVAAAMATAESEPALASRSALLERHLSQAGDVIEDLNRIGAARQTASALERNLTEVGDLAIELSRTVGDRLHLHGRLGERIRSLSSEHAAFNAAADPLIAQELQFLGAESEAVVDLTEGSVARLNDISLKDLIPVLSMSVQVSAMKKSLLDALAADIEPEVDRAWAP